LEKQEKKIDQKQLKTIGKRIECKERNEKRGRGRGEKERSRLKKKGKLGVCGKMAWGRGAKVLGQGASGKEGKGRTEIRKKRHKRGESKKYSLGY